MATTNTVQHFSPEILGCVFDLVGDKATLLNAALVCDVWSKPAQTRLWRDVDLQEFGKRDSLRIEEFVASQDTIGRKMVTKRLTINGAASNEVLRSVVGSCRGVKELALGPMKNERELNLVDLLQLESLEGMSSFNGPINREYKLITIPQIIQG